MQTMDSLTEHLESLKREANNSLRKKYRVNAWSSRYAIALDNHLHLGREYKNGIMCTLGTTRINMWQM